ncbi:MAG: phage terminase small subunit P27 family [Rickettsiales bacterium]
MGKRGTKPKVNLGKKRPGAPSLPSPDYLGRDGREEWQRMCAMLNVEALDRTALLLYCDAYDIFCVASRQMAEGGQPLVCESAEGGAYYNMLLAVKDKAAARMHKFLALFGLAPADRARLQSENPAMFAKAGEVDEPNAFDGL